MIRSARTGLLRHDHPASRIRALPTGRRDQLQLFDAVLDLRRAPAWQAFASPSAGRAEVVTVKGIWAHQRLFAMLRHPLFDAFAPVLFLVLIQPATTFLLTLYM